MNSLKKAIIIVVISILAIITILSFSPLVFDSSKDTSSVLIETREGIVSIDRTSIVPPVVIYLVLSKEDTSNPLHYGEIVRYTSDTIMIGKTLNMMRFARTHTDICTTSSKIYIVSNNNVIFKSDISIAPNNTGIQSTEFGWCKAIDSDSLMAVFSQFSDYRKPFLLLK